MLDSLHVLTLNQTARKVFSLSSHRLNHTSVPLIVGNQIYLTSLAGRTLASLWFHSFSVFTARTMWLLYSISILFLSRQVWLLICKVKQKNQSTRWHANLRGSGENKERKTAFLWCGAESSPIHWWHPKWPASHLFVFRWTRVNESVCNVGFCVHWASIAPIQLNYWLHLYLSWNAVFAQLAYNFCI